MLRKLFFARAIYFYFVRALHFVCAHRLPRVRTSAAFACAHRLPRLCTLNTRITVHKASADVPNPAHMTVAPQ
eukprot:5040958-Pyramimonas_sp.AAC.1